MQITYTYVKTHALRQLKTAQSLFNHNPNSTNWNVLTRCMLVHQQAVALRKEANIQRLLERLETLPLGQWDEAIVHQATGLSVNEVLFPS